MQIFIVGVDHELQGPRPGTMSNDDLPAAEVKDKERFRQLLTRLARNRAVSFVGEEHFAPLDTIPRQVAHALGIRHEYVEMRLEERAVRGIPEDYARDETLSKEQVQAYHREREAYMVSRMETLAASDESCILVCGRCHMDGLAALLRAQKHDVEVVDVGELPGFDFRWLRDRMCI